MRLCKYREIRKRQLYIIRKDEKTLEELQEKIIRLRNEIRSELEEKKWYYEDLNRAKRERDEAVENMEEMRIKLSNLTLMLEQQQKVIEKLRNTFKYTTSGRF